MQRRIIAAVAAVTLAGIGAALLYSWVSSSEQRAMSSMESTNVVVVTKAVPAGTLASNLTPYVEVRQLPKVAVAPEAFTALDQLTQVGTLAATSSLEVGEQVLPSRFAEPNTTSTGSVEVPTNMQLLSLPIDASRAVGATLAAGNRIAVYASGDDPRSGDKVTQLLLRDVLLVEVQGGVVSGDSSAAPSGSLVLTVALEPKDMARLVWAEENSKVWLALEPKDGGTQKLEIRVKTK